MCIDFLPNLRQTQNTVEQMKKNCFAFNGTRRSLCESEVLCVLELLAHQCEIDAEKAEKNIRKERRKKATFAECLVMIMVVTFLIEFRLPNFSPTVSRTRLESFSVNEK